MATSKIVTRAVPAIMLIILLSSVGTNAAKNCGVLVSEDPLCFAANADACDTWCYHKGYDNGKCYGGPGDGDKTCICHTECPKDSLTSAAKPTGRPRKIQDHTSAGETGRA